MTASRPIQDIYPLSPMQQGMLFHSLMAPSEGLYVWQMSCRLEGELDRLALRRALARIVERHAILRTSFLWEDLDQPLQVVARETAVPIAEEDWSRLDKDGQRERLEACLAQDLARGFDPRQAPLMRLLLAREGDRSHRLVWSLHMLLLDGWSVAKLTAELFLCYEAFRQDREPGLGAPPPFRSYIAWLLRQDRAVAEGFWRRELAGFTAPTPLPGDRGAQDAPDPVRHTIPLSEETTAALQALARGAQVTLGTLIQAGWALLLARTTGERDLVFGVTVSGRPPDLPGVESMVGLFINTVPLRAKVAAEIPLFDWLRDLQQRQVESRQFEHVPLPEVQGWSEVPRKAQLFESLVIFENYPPGAQDGGQDASLELTDLRLVNFTNYPLVLLAQPGRRLTLQLDVDRARFGAEAPVLLARLAGLLERMARQRPDRLGDLLQPSPPELQQILREWNDSAAELPAAGLDLAAVLAAQAAERPEAVAALCAGRRLTYRELSAGSERLACALSGEGVGPESRVALLAERSLDFLVAILGIFRAGGAYLPLDPRHPRRRLAGLLANSGVELAIAGRQLFPVLAEAAGELPAAVRPRLHVLEDLAGLAGRREVEQPRFEPRRLAYLLYTSGSTGTPKGVMIEQGGMLNHLWAKVRDLGLGPGDVVAQTASQSFDISVWQFLAALLAGGSVHVFPDEVAHDPRRLFAAVESGGITVLETVPSLLRLALEELDRQGPGRPALQRLRWLIPTGEALPAELCGQWLRLYPGVPLLNAYGPTECSDDITHHPIRHGQEPVRPPTPIGRPVANLRAYVLDGAMAPLPAGVAGELFVGGAGVGRGYLGDGARTAQAFVPDPFAGERGQRLYRTGDLARFRADGRLDFLGRIDHQVKIRGHRIELGEIESVLGSHPLLRATAVLAREDVPGDRRLVAYLVPRAGRGMAERDLAQVREVLSTELPEAMVPSAFVVLEELPLSPNGKLDRKALPAPAPTLSAAEGSFAPPQGPIEELVAEIWAGVLRVERVGARDDFFDLGGHSLLATQVTSRVRSVLGVELPLRALFEDPTVAALARRIERERSSGAAPQAPPLRPAPRDGDLPLSFAQQRLWFLDQLQPGTPLYNIPLSVRLTGPLDRRALEAGLGRIVARHESLRTTFPLAGGQPVQRISAPGPWRLPQVDLQALPKDRRRPESLRLATEESRLPFDLARGPLLRAALLRLGEGEHAILLTQHHVVSDGWSVQVLMRELAALYPALAEGRPDPLPPLPLQYPDFAVWQRSWLQGEILERETAFWREQLSGAPTVLALPLDRPRPPVSMFRGAWRERLLPQDLGKAVLALSRREGLTPFMTLLAAFATLLARSSGQTDVLVATPIANRNREEIESLIGFFVNTLALRVQAPDSGSFAGLLAAVRETTLAAYAHQDLPFEKLVDDLDLPRDLSVNPLCQVMLTYQNLPPAAGQLPGLAVRPLARGALETGTAKFDLTLLVREDQDRLGTVLQFNTDLFDAPTAERLLGHLEILLAGIAADPQARVADVELLTAAERHQLLADWNDTAQGWAGDACLHTLFSEQARRTPGHAAAVFEEESLTYAELESRANRLAHHLRRLGVGPEVRVALCFERSIEMVVALFGVLKAGGAYVPLDPAAPAERLAGLLRDLERDGEPAPLLTQAGLAGRLPAHTGTVLRLDADWPLIDGAEHRPPASGVTPANAAYILYTSGSTGRPKGVVVEHRQIVNYLRAVIARLELAPGASAGLLQPLSVDSGKTALYPPLLVGGTLHLISEERALDAAALGDYFRRHAVDLLKIAPSHLAALQSAPAPQDVLPRGWLALGGEASRAEWAAALATLEPACRVFIHYGPTETTVGVLAGRIGPGGPAAGISGTAPLGRPLAGTRIYLLDRGMRPVGLGIPGELCIGGANVARGYDGRPDLTAERFVPDPFGAVPGARLYRTGDLARYLPDARVEFLGRFDHQVKIRGFRIELGEIESTLSRCPGVREAAVAAREDGGGAKRLVAYLLPRGEARPDGAELQRYAQERLPGYMVPTAFVWLEDFPRSPQGKLDRKRLPAPEPSPERHYEAPRNSAEERLAEVWKQVLRVERLGIHDNFFSLGGDSILSIQVISRASAAGLRLTARQVFEHPTVAGLAAVAEEAGDRKEAGWSDRPTPLTPIQQRFFEQDRVHPEHYNQAVLLSSSELDERRLGPVLEHLAAHHEALCIRFERHPEGGWQQVYRSGGPGGFFSQVDLRALPRERQRESLEEVASRLQASLDLSRGPLLRAAVFTSGSGEPCRLLLAIHHLVVDGVSWRILLEDLETACRQLAAGEAVSLPPRTSSYQSWAERLAAHAASPELAAQAEIWLAERRRPLSLPRVFPAGLGTAATAARVAVALTAAETRALLQDVPRAYRTQINDALLTALVESFGAWTGSRRLLVDLESHGRAEIFPDLDLSRTVGWFTAVHPVLLDTTGAAGTGAALCTVKERLRAVPDQGIGYGVLRYLGQGEMADALRALPHARVLFNYLGQLDQALPARSLFQAAGESAGAVSDPRQRRLYPVEINGGVREGRLQLTWICERRDREAVEAWAGRFQEALRGLIEHCLSPEAGGYTPADFPLARIRQAELDLLASESRGAAIEDLYPAAPVQEGMLFHSLQEPGSGVYVEQLSLHLQAGLDLDAFERAWERLVRRHPALRTTFHWHGLARPLQRVHAEVELPWERHDLRELPADERQPWLESFLEEDRRRGFDLTRPPLLRLALIRLGDQEHQFVWSHHHILFDGWSTSILLNELFSLYEAGRRGEEAVLGPVRPYRDFIAWLEGSDAAAAEAFWRRTLAGLEEPTALGLAKTQAAGEAARGERFSRLPAPETASLQRFSRTHRLTLATVVQGAWALLLGRYHGGEDVLFGAVTSGRSAPLAGIESMVGLFINTLPARVQVPGGAELVAWLQEIQESQAEARQYENSRLTEIQGWSEIPRGTPLFDTLLVFENYPVDATLEERVDRSLRIGGSKTAEQTHYPLCLEAASGSRFILKALYDGRLFDHAAVDRLLGHLQTLLAGIASGAGQRLEALPLLSPEERSQLLVEAAGAPARPGVAKSFESWVTDWARLRPEAPAVVDGSQVLTYRELDTRSNRLARRLLRLGLLPDGPVVVSMERSPEMLVAVLAVLKAGGAYVPLDPSYPRERLAWMLDDALGGGGAAVVLTQERLADRFPAEPSPVHVIRVDADWEEIARESGGRLEVRTDPGNLAYVIYTSGSTGRPKGVAMTRRALQGLLDWQETAGGLSGAARTLQFASLSFDVSFQEIFSTWRAGGTLYLIDEERRRDATALLARLEEAGIERLFLPFVALRHLAEAAGERPGQALRLRDVIAAGEQLQVTPAMVRWFSGLEGCRLHNHYGPSETHVVTAATFGGAAADWPALPSIGRPIDGATIRLLGPGLEPVPLGVAGELYIGGPALARGYHGRPGLTALRFIPDPFGSLRGEPGARLYRTGDLALWTPGLEIEYLGRLDQQVKVRGFRVEPGEIEAVLSQHPAVREAVVEARPEPGTGGKRLIAYVVPSGPVAPAPEELRGSLRGRLPEHMVPAAFVVLDSFPLTPSGKLNRRALPDPAAPETLEPREAADLADPVTELIASLWADVLGRDRVLARDDFFDLGGHSLLAVQVISRVRSLLKVDVPLQTLFAEPALERFAGAVRAAIQSGAGPALPPIQAAGRDGDLPLSFAQQRLWFLYQLDAGSPAYNIATACRLEGRLEAGVLRASVDEIVRRHEALRTTFHGRGEAAVQRIAPAAPVPLPVIDLAGLPRSARDEERARFLQRERDRPFDLSRGPLFRIRLLSLGEQEHVLLLTIHHIASDGWSMGVLVRELGALYRAFSRREPSPLPELAIQYADFAAWQRSWLTGDVLDGLIAAWRTRLAGAPAALELPTDRPRPPVQTFRGGVSPFRLGKEETATLRALARREGATLFMVALAGFQALLHRHSGQDDLVTGTPIAGRSRAETEGLIGVFINMLALRGGLAGEPAFRELVARTRDTALEAYALQDLPFEKLVEEIRPERDLARSPLFQAVLVLQNAPREDLTLPGLTLTALPAESGTTKFELLLTLVEQPGGLAGGLEYNADLFDRATAERLLAQLGRLLAGAAAEPGGRLGDLPLLGASERHQILTEWNDTAAKPPAASLDRLFAGQAERTPEAVAIVHGRERWTYRELNDRAARLARQLRRLGAGPEVRVGICLERSPDLIAALLATLAAGGAYVPLDPAYPAERLSYMLRDSGAALLLTQQSLLGRVAGLAPRVFTVDGEQDAPPAPDAPAFADPGQLAYVIYTSGSTGRPKGVMIPHRNAVNRIAWAQQAFPARDLAGVLAATSVCFDLSVFEIFVPLSCGGTVILADNALALPGLPAAGEVTLVNTVPSAIAELVRSGRFPASVRTVNLAGEPLKGSLVREVYARSGAERIFNLYGPTEDTTYSTGCAVDGEGDPRIGRPLPGTRALVLDADLRLLPLGAPGGLYLGGSGLARGYLGRPDLTAASFLPDPYAPAGSRLYRTGDLARWRPDGSLEFLGRLDHQVKVRGFRIELGEIETALCELPAVREAAVLALGQGVHRRLSAFVALAEEATAGAPELRQALRERLPEPMVPAAWHFLPALPLSANGKIDRRALSRLGSEPGPGAGDGPATPPQTAMEQQVAAAWRDVLGLAQVGRHDNFFDLGGHSLLLLRLQERLRASLDREIPLVDLFRHPTVEALARSLTRGAEDASAPLAARGTRAAGTDSRIAIIGMSGRFPGAAGVEDLWRNLCAGVESIVRLSEEELLEAGVDPETLRHPRYVRASAPLADVDLFDADFFGFTPRDAEITDPQHRLFLECAWEAIEASGYDPAAFPGRIGVYAGVRRSGYLIHLYRNPEALRSAGAYKLDIANDKDHLPTTVSYKLNLRGPSLAVQTACSSSLVAAHLACRSLIAGDCDMALAGGAAISWPLRTGYLYQEGGILSPDGHCRAFDAQAQGTVGGSGAGVVLLKRLTDALADGDTIHAVILGSAVNNDGSLKVGYTAPSVEGQAQVITAALAEGGVDPRTVRYVEAHGTGTPLGDPIEVAALTQAFRTGTADRGFCAIGSMKANLGHLDAAAGVAGLIKTAQALQHGQIPPSLHFTTPNPKIDFAASPFYVNDRLAEWKSGDGPRRAGVSSFGIGGTNAHMVLEEPPPAEPGTPPRRPWNLLVLSARTPSALEASSALLGRFLEERPETALADAAWTLQTGRRAFRHRRAVLCRDAAEAVAALAKPGGDRAEEGRGVIFLFPGQGAQHPGMGLGLYRSEPVFRAEMDRAAEILLPWLGGDLRDLLKGELENTGLAQPALFAVEHALARLWASWGLSPEAMIGHSLGEYTAACLAGVFSFEDGLALVAQRGRLVAALPPGSMASLPLSEAEVSPLLGPGLALAAVNGSAQCVVSGPGEEIQDLLERLAARGIEGRRLRTSHAFHSAMMDPAVAPFAAAVGRVRLSPPRIPWVSNVTGTWITDAEATDPGYWARHLRATVRFADGLSTLLRHPADRPAPVLLEAGPGRTLSALARRHPDRSPAHPVVTSLRHPDGAEDDVETVLSALGQLWAAGAPVDWQALHDGERRRRIPLPTYPFERRRYWVEPGRGEATEERSPADRFWTPFWKPEPWAPAGEGGHGPWLVFLAAAEEAGDGVGEALLDHLRRLGAETVAVRLDGRLRRREDYDALLSGIARERGSLPPRILHLGSAEPLEPADGLPERLARLEQEKDRGFYSLLFLIQALGDRGGSETFEITAVTSGAQRVAPGDLPCPERAMVLALCRVAPREHAGITCRAIDVGFPLRGSWLGRIAAEIAAPVSAPLSAWRGGGRWLPDLTPVRLATRSSLREGDVWLVTGGLGGVGLEIAEHLAAARARVVLLGRTGLPPEEEREALPGREGTPGADLAAREIELRHQLGVRGLASRPGAQESLDAFCSARLLRFLIEAGIEVRRGAPLRREDLRLLPKFHRFFDFLLETLAEDGWVRREGDTAVFQVDAAGAPDPAALAREAALRHPFLRSLFERVERCAAGYGPALSGDGEALQYLFSGGEPGEPAESLSHTPVYTALAAEIASRAAGRCAAAGRTLRVLEAGGGQGVLTRQVAPVLSGRGAEYWFTDLGRLFVTEAEREAARAGLDFLRFGVLDASRDPAEQGYEPESFDLLFALNVVHATPDVEATLRNLRRLLRPGGELCLIELTRRQRWMDMVWGLAEGWWLFSDAYRHGSPLIDLEAWKEALARAGFEVAAALPEDEDGRADADCGLLLATRPAAVAVSDPALRADRVRRMRALGAEVAVEAADAADLEALRAAVRRTVERFGRLDGVIHAAGVPGGRLLALQTREALEEELAAKVRGALALGEVCRELPPGQIVVFSSTSALLAQPGQTGYCAANAFLDAWAHLHAAETGIPTLALDWDRWQGTGMAVAVERRHRELTGEEMTGGLSPAEGVEAFDRALASGLEQVVVSAGDFAARWRRAQKAGASVLEALERRPAPASIHERPPLATPYSPPSDELEREIAEVWQEVFGIERIGIHDNFFELGGDSLVALQLVSRLGRTLGVELRVRSLFDAPTIAALAVAIEEAMIASASQEELELALDEGTLP